VRVINRSDLDALIPDDWYSRADAALEELERLPPEARQTFINANATIWRELKQHLNRISHGKCWYSEVLIADTDLEVEHFRPKGKISKAATPHRGYWWLAFNHNNLRLASPLVNKRRTDARQGDVQGKGSFFPLLDETNRVPDDSLPPRDTRHERPVLIDPCNGADVMLLDYSIERGKVSERFTVDQNEIRFKRAKASIEFYHLNEGTLIKKRKGLQVRIERLAQRIDDLAQRQESTGLSAEQEREYGEVFHELSSLIGASAEFSAFARACINQRGNRGWTEALLISA
jgi:uncharacterized protein (TIGR02646 family)